MLLLALDPCEAHLAPLDTMDPRALSADPAVTRAGFVLQHVRPWRHGPGWLAWLRRGDEALPPMRSTPGITRPSSLALPPSPTLDATLGAAAAALWRDGHVGIPGLLSQWEVTSLVRPAVIAAMQEQVSGGGTTSIRLITWCTRLSSLNSTHTLCHPSFLVVVGIARPHFPGEGHE
jgi:hypothetical protein